ncbi:sentrin-specific protease 6 isoform X2 [Scleropages formosus]|uniref:sentrin-specific protease 6 isoform X2 n=1 Tax=Scleropages formosus TaxID=113540 RepID=UPI0010FAC185|nr:sentrin-specific protease 6 isoform X2 [Scleropages formosus]
MAHRRSVFIEALERSESKKHGGFQPNWSFSLSDASEEQSGHHPSPVTMDEADGQQELTPEGRKSPQLKHFSSVEHLKTYERKVSNQSRMLKGNYLGLNKLGAGKKLSENPHAVTPTSNRTNYFVVSSTPPQGVLVQGRLFQHANAPATVRKNTQSLDLKERKDFNTQQIQRVEVDSIILTCPEVPATKNLVFGEDVKRRVQNKRRPVLEASGNFPSSASKMEPLDPQDYLTVCGKCCKPSEDHVRCQNCGNPLAEEASPGTEPTEPASTPTRTPIRPHTTLGPNNLQLNKGFYGPSSGVRTPQVDVVMNPPVRITRGSLLPPHNGGAGGTPAGSKSKWQPLIKQQELNDPIVLSSDDDDEEEEEEGENGSTGSVNRMDNVSPRPADSAHSSPAPSCGRVEATLKLVQEEHEEITADYFTDVDCRISVPRKARMKDQFGNLVSSDTVVTPPKRRKVNNNMDSIILDCRSVRLGTLRRMVTKPVIFSVDYIQLETEGPETDVLEKVSLRASELTSCEWCTVRKLPVLFLQTSPAECLRLRTQLKMSREKSVWYDCKAPDPDEQHIVLIFEDGLSMQSQGILEEILQKIGRANNLSNFPAKLPFHEANKRLVRYNTPERKKEESRPMRTRLSSHLLTFFDADDEDDDMTEMQPTFTGPIVKLIVYPPPPAKGGISVTNEDLHCLNDGEFLNDVIIDFYLKYLVLEKLKKEDAHRSHVFSSFFYKRLNQRERKSVPDTSNLPIQKKKHNRVKTWTRHVDLFQKDFIFVPINESAHWYLAVICFPGLDGQKLEPNPLYQAPAVVGRSSCTEDEHPEEEAPQRPACKEEAGGRLEQPPTTPGSTGFNITDTSSESDSNSDQAKGGMAPSRVGGGEASTGQNGQSSAQLHYTGKIRGVYKGVRGISSTTTSAAMEIIKNNKGGPKLCAEGYLYNELHRISVCYGSTGDTYTFSDDQSSSQDECSEDGTLADETLGSSQSEWTSRPTICKQPCILIMDSLRGPARSTVVKTLREYLEVEWEAKKGTQRSFGKDVMRGSSPRVPQQDNYSDCGVYVLQYVESFFENPIPSFHLPMNLSDWFPQQRMKKKRDEIRELILKIQSQQQLDKKVQDSQKDFEPGRVAEQNSSASS